MKNVLSTVKSVCAAAMGVSTNKMREQDFSSQSPYRFIIGGLIFTVAFVVFFAVIAGLLAS